MVDDANGIDSGTKDVRVEVRGAVAFAWLNRPRQGNSVHGRLLGDLVEAVEDTDSNDDIRVVVTIGEGSTWCVGADKNVFAQLGTQDGIDLCELGYQGVVGGDWGMPQLSAGQKRADTLGMGRWIHRFLNVSTPTIAAINGGVAGGGVALALLHDLRIASTRAKFSPAFITLGLSPEMGLSWFLPRIVGYSKAFDVITRTAPIEADEALELGLVHSVVKPANWKTRHSHLLSESLVFHRCQCGWRNGSFVNRPHRHWTTNWSVNGKIKLDSSGSLRRNLS